MGGDGGTITKKTHITLHNSIKDGKVAPDDNRKAFSDASIWQCCRLSNKPLQEPIVSDYKGRLFNKIEIVKWLLSKDKLGYTKEQQDEFMDIKRLDDIVELHDISVVHDGNKSNEVSVRCNFGEDILSENKTFVYLTKCGCVLPKVAVSQKKTSVPERRCPNCNTAYDDLDIVFINPANTSKESSELEERITKLREMKLHHNGKPLKLKKRSKTKDQGSESKRQKKSTI